MLILVIIYILINSSVQEPKLFVGTADKRFRLIEGDRGQQGLTDYDP